MWDAGLIDSTGQHGEAQERTGTELWMECDVDRREEIEGLKAGKFARLSNNIGGSGEALVVYQKGGYQISRDSTSPGE
jgi:hypothetical protein